MNTPPEVKIGIGADGERYGIAGLEDLDRWAMLNDPLWRQLTRHAQIVGINEYDRFRLLAAALLKERVTVHAKRIACAQQHGTAPY